jgi:hypothetical protein
MRNLTFTECLFIWRTKSPRLRFAVLCWMVGLRKIALRASKSSHHRDKDG